MDSDKESTLGTQIYQNILAKKIKIFSITPLRMNDGIERLSASAKQNKGIITQPIFTNVCYDTCTYKNQIKQSTKQGKYNLSGRLQENCFQSYPGYQRNSTKNINSMNVDIESDLRNQTRLLTKCPENEYSPLTNCVNCSNCNGGLPCGCPHCKKRNSTKDCNTQFQNIESRDMHSCAPYGEIFINRFQSLCVDAQQLNRIQDNGFIGSNTRLYERDKKILRK